MKRWMAEISYQTGREPKIVTFEEIGTPAPEDIEAIRELCAEAGTDPSKHLPAAEDGPSLHAIIEGGPDWHEIDQIVITLNRPVIQPKPEEPWNKTRIS